MPATVLPPEPLSPATINSCPSCSHWLPDGTLVCPDCATLTYGSYLGELAAQAQQLESQGKWAEARDRWRSALMWLPENTQQAATVQQRIALIDRRFEAEEEQKSRWTKRLGPFAPVALFLIKFKSAFFLLFKLKFLISYLAFFGLYWAIWGWQFALGFMLCIAIHEMGHYVAAKRRGLAVDLPMFLPGMGAYVRWYGAGVSRVDLATISLAGPLYGLGAALACLGLFYATHLPIFMVLANVAAWLNLLNLVPVLGLDGAKAVYALSHMQRALIAAASLVFFGLTVSASNGDLMSPESPAQWVFLFIGIGMLWRCFTHDEPEAPHTNTMAYFLGLVLALGFLLVFTHNPTLAASSAVGRYGH